MLKGVDVSKHNGKIDWNKTKNNIDFAMIRAGYGKNNIDERLEDNINGCKKNNIPFGLYWFSYALNIDMIKNEANYLCDIADKYKPVYPLAFDWEYDSDDYAKRKGVILNNSHRKQFADTFLSIVEARGYYALLYSNIDYLNKGFRDLLVKYGLWLAQWSSKPTINCAIWQKSEHGTVAGINTKVDINESFIDFSKNVNHIISNEKSNNITFEEKVKLYLDVIEKIINGDYGNGEERKKHLESEQYDYKVIQDFLNAISKMI